MKDLWRVDRRPAVFFLSASYQPNRNPCEIRQPLCAALIRLYVSTLQLPDQCSQEDHSLSLLSTLFPLSISLFRPHFFPILPPLLFSPSSIISHLLWFKSSGLSLSACGSSKTNGSSLHLLLITPHPPSPFLSLPSPLPRPSLLLQPPFSNSPPPFFSLQHRKKMNKKEKQDNWR